MQSSPDAEVIFGKALAEHLKVVGQIAEQHGLLETIALAMTAALRSGGKILWCGNGGSAADAQHMAAELIGRFRRERRAMPSIALTTDSSILTCLANDYGYETVFSRQVEALGGAGDLLVGISTSGNSGNVLAALQAAKAKGLTTVAFTGTGGGKMAAFADFLFAVESRDTARIQEAHIFAGHMLCDWIELDWAQAEAAALEAAAASTAGVKGLS